MPTKVLIATDGSDFAVQAAKRAAALLQADAALTVVSVVQPPVVPSAAPATGLDVGPIVTPEASEELDEALTEEAEDALERTAAALGRPVERVQLHGDPAAEIVRLAEKGGFDVIALGSHGRGLVKRVLIGSVSHHVIQHAPCPVLVIHARD